MEELEIMFLQAGQVWEMNQVERRSFFFFLAAFVIVASSFSHPPTLLIMSQEDCGALPTGFWSAQVKTEKHRNGFYFQK